MVINVQSPEMQEVIAYMNPDIDSYPIWAGGLNEYIMGSVSAGYSAFLSLNHENAKWNIKTPIQEELGDAVILCGTKSCGWFDYSTPGNIHFGFMAAAAGIPRGVSQGAGGAIQSAEALFGDAEWHREWSKTLFEDPRDWAAVEFGYYLYEKYGAGMTVEQFQSELTLDVMSTFQEPDWYGMNGDPVHVPGPAVPQENHFPSGFFDYEP